MKHALSCTQNNLHCDFRVSQKIEYLLITLIIAYLIPLEIYL